MGQMEYKLKSSQQNFYKSYNDQRSSTYYKSEIASDDHSTDKFSKAFSREYYVKGKLGSYNKSV